MLVLMNTDMKVSVIIEPDFPAAFQVPANPLSLSPKQGIINSIGFHKLRIAPISSVSSIQIMQITIYVNG